MSNLYTQKISRPGLGEIDATAKQAAGRRCDPGHWAGKLAAIGLDQRIPLHTRAQA